MLFASKSLHVHPIEILSIAWSNFGFVVWHSDWYVELRYVQRNALQEKKKNYIEILLSNVLHSNYFQWPDFLWFLSILCWLGCILAELYTGYPIFPGENEVEQLACIMEVLNVPPEDVLNQASRRRLFFDSRGNPRCITNSKNRKRKPGTKPLAQVLRCNDPLFVDFVSKCLE